MPRRHCLAGSRHLISSCSCDPLRYSQLEQLASVCVRTCEPFSCKYQSGCRLTQEIVLAPPPLLVDPKWKNCSPCSVFVLRASSVEQGNCCNVCLHPTSHLLQTCPRISSSPTASLPLYDALILDEVYGHASRVGVHATTISVNRCRNFPACGSHARRADDHEHSGGGV